MLPRGHGFRTSALDFGRLAPATHSGLQVALSVSMSIAREFSACSWPVFLPLHIPTERLRYPQIDKTKFS